VEGVHSPPLPLLSFFKNGGNLQRGFLLQTLQNKTNAERKKCTMEELDMIEFGDDVSSPLLFLSFFSLLSDLFGLPRARKSKSTKFESNWTK
jgi:hypothetical protein